MKCPSEEQVQAWGTLAGLAALIFVIGFLVVDVYILTPRALQRSNMNYQHPYKTPATFDDHNQRFLEEVKKLEESRNK